LIAKETVARCTRCIGFSGIIQSAGVEKSRREKKRSIRIIGTLYFACGALLEISGGGGIIFLNNKKGNTN